MSIEHSSVLIIENQPLMRSALRTTLQAEGFSVVESAWDNEVIQAAAKLNPDLILFSVGMPGTEDELEAISSLRHALPLASIVALVTGEFSGQEQMALNHGAHIVLVKSVSSSTLVNTIKKELNKTQHLEEQ
jgi:DNA-binding NarL/FixJ family response regulator